MKNKLKITGFVIAFLFGLYGVYWVGKTASYNMFYESMVKETVKETVIDMVKQRYLK